MEGEMLITASGQHFTVGVPVWDDLFHLMGGLCPQLFDFTLAVLLSKSPQYWEHRCTLPSLAYYFWFILVIYS